MQRLSKTILATTAFAALAASAAGAVPSTHKTSATPHRTRRSIKSKVHKPKDVGVKEFRGDSLFELDENLNPTLISSNCSDGEACKIIPASLTKLMTIYIVLDHLGQDVNGKPFTLNSQIPLGSKSISVQNALLAMATVSDNNVAKAVGRYFGGGNPKSAESEFAKNYMNTTAQSLKMYHTFYLGASGLDNGQYTTEPDLLLLSLAILRKFPSFVAHFPTENDPGLFEHPTFGRGRKNFNHNAALLGQHTDIDPGSVVTINGLKTGIINESGYNVIALAKNATHQFLGMVWGGRSLRDRKETALNLFKNGFHSRAANAMTVQNTSGEFSPFISPEDNYFQIQPDKFSNWVQGPSFNFIPFANNKNQAGVTGPIPKQEKFFCVTPQPVISQPPPPVPGQP